VRQVMRLLRRHYGKLAALSIPRPYHRGHETALAPFVALLAVICRRSLRRLCWPRNWPVEARRV
jgi:hypothetical protein